MDPGNSFGMVDIDEFGLRPDAHHVYNPSVLLDALQGKLGQTDRYWHEIVLSEEYRDDVQQHLETLSQKFMQAAQDNSEKMNS
jgi:hypothetical protein